MLRLCQQLQWYKTLSAIYQLRPLQIYRCVQLNSVMSSRWSTLVVINIDSLTRGALSGKLHGGRSQLLFALQQSSIDSQLFVENRDLCYPPAFDAPVTRGPRRKIAVTFGEKWQNTRPWQTDERRRFYWLTSSSVCCDFDCNYCWEV